MRRTVECGHGMLRVGGIVRWWARSLCVLPMLCPLVFACGRVGSPPGASGGSADAGGPGMPAPRDLPAHAAGEDAVGGPSSPEPSPADFSVHLRADRPTVCLGQCTRLRAQIEGGVPPFAYAWGDGGGTAPSAPPSNPQDAGSHTGSDAASIQVCPDATQDYHLAVTEFGGGQEFRRSTRASLTVAVARDCDDGPGTDAGDDPVEPGEAPDAGGEGPAETPPAALERRCQHVASMAWGPRTTSNASIIDGYDFASQLAVDGHDNVALAVGFGGVWNIDGRTLDAFGGQYGLLVSKYGPDCEVLWSRTFGALFGWVGGASVAAYDDKTVVAGTFLAAVDFGLGPLLASPTQGGVLLQLDGQGRTMWNQAFSGMGGVHFVDVDARPDGTIAALGYMYGDGAIAGVPVVLPAGASAVSFLSVFGGDGTHQWTRALPDGLDGAFVRFAADSDDILVLGTMQDRMTLLRFDGRGQPRFRTDEMGSEARFLYPTLGLGVAADGTVVTSTVVHGADVGVRLGVYGPDGSLTREQLIPRSEGLTAFGGAVDLRDADHVYELGARGDDPSVRLDVRLDAYDGHGRPTARSEIASPAYEWPLDMVLDRDGGVVMAVVRMETQERVELLLLRHARQP